MSMLVHRIVEYYNQRASQFIYLSSAMFWERHGEEQSMWEALFGYAEHACEAQEIFETFDDEELAFILGNRVPLFILEANYE